MTTLSLALIIAVIVLTVTRTVPSARANNRIDSSSSPATSHRLSLSEHTINGTVGITANAPSLRRKQDSDVERKAPSLEKGLRKYGGHVPVVEHPGSRMLVDQTAVLPQLIGDWIPILDYPEDIGEAQGAIVGGKYLVVVGGFLPDLVAATPETYALDLSNPNQSSWHRLANHPIQEGVTHAGHAVHGHRYYLCGGYLGPHPGPEIADCNVLDITADGGHGAWIALPELPKPRGAGAMVYIDHLNSLLFAFGAIRPNGEESTVDQSSTWMLDLSNAASGWVKKAPSPYLGNHLSAVSAIDCEGKQHIYFLGGQENYNEFSGNINLMYEYLPDSNQWIKRKDLRKGRGHFTSSAVPYGCGFMIIAGAVNGADPTKRTRTKDIDYYDIPTNTWTKIGYYTQPTSVPVCGIHDDQIFCTTGYRPDGWKRRLSYPSPSILQPPSAKPSAASPASRPSDIYRLILVNAENGNDIEELYANMTIDSSAVQINQVSIRADVLNSSHVESVVFDLTPDPTNQFPRIESHTPYTLNGDTKGKYAPYQLQIDTVYTVTGTPWSQDDGHGVQGVPLVISFRVV